MSPAPALPEDSRIPPADELALLPWSDAIADAAAPLLAAASTTGQPVSLLALEIDHFELIDRTHGMRQSEAVLREVVARVRGALRGRDLLGRRHGAELLILLPGLSTLAARETADRLVALVRESPIVLPEAHVSLPATLSIGVATAPDHASTFPALLAAAERARDRVRQEGRDGAALALPPADEPPHRPLAVGHFVGRSDQLRTLVRWLDNAVHRAPRVVTVSGESGIGRSALLAQLEPEAQLRGGVMVRATCRAHDVAEPYGVWADVLRGLRERVAVPERTWHELPRLLPALAPAGTLELRGGSQFRLMEELSEFVRGAAAQRPLVLALEEMQWADAASWDALEHLVRQLADAPILLCLTLRSDVLDPERRERLQQLARIGSVGMGEITLSRLTRDEVKRWLEAALHGQEVGRELLSFLYRHTEGNPLFMSQLLHTLAEEGALWHSGDRWEWQPVSALRLPIGRDALIARRLARLSAETQAVLGAAAFLDRPFDAALLADISGAAEAPHVARAIAEAREAAILRPLGRPRSGFLDFAHDEFAVVLRRTPSPRRAKQTHARIAAALERRPGISAVAVARHFDLAEDAAQAYRFALRASAEAEALYAHTAASELLRVAARNAESPAELAEVRVRLASLAELAARYDEAEELCDLAIEWYTSQHDVARTITLRRIRERVRSQLGQPARRTLEALLRLDDEARALGLDGERVAILALVSQTYFRLGDSQAATRLAADCVGMAERLGDPALLANAINRLGNAIQRGEPERARELFLRALAIYEELGDFRGQARVHANLGACADQLGRPGEARDAMRMSLTISRTAGLPEQSGMAAMSLGVFSMRRGEHAQARELFGEALSLFASVKGSEMQLFALYNLAHLDREQGEYATAAESYNAAASLAQRVGYSEVEIGANAGAGLCYLSLGDLERAGVLVSALEERLALAPHWFQGRELVEALRVRFALAEGRRDQALALFEAAMRLADPADSYASAWLAAACLGRLYAGDPETRRKLVERYRARVGPEYSAINRQYEALEAE